MNKRQSLEAIIRRQADFDSFRLQDLIADPVIDTDRVCIPGSIDCLAMAGFDLGVAPWSMRIEGATMNLKRSDQHETALHKLLAEIGNPASGLSSDWFTDGDFARFFGLTEGDIEKITAWMRSHQLESLTVSPARTSITFSGNLLAVEVAFHTEFHGYRFEERHYLANAFELWVPAAFASVMSGFCNLSVLAPQMEAKHRRSRLWKKYK